MINFKRQENETDDELIFRVCSLKSTETWQEIGDGLNEELGNLFSESAYRKKYQSFQKMFDSVKHKVVDSNEHLLELEKKQDELYKQQVKTRDSVREYRATLRDEARVEVIIDAIKSVANKQPKLEFYENYEYGDT